MQWPGDAAILPLREPGAVAAGEQNQGAFGEFEPAQRVEHPADAPVHFLDPVAIRAIGGLALKCRAGMERDVDGGVREVEEKWVVLVGGNEIHGFRSVAGGERVLVGGRFDHLSIAQQGQRRARLGLVVLLLSGGLFCGRVG